MARWLHQSRRQSKAEVEITLPAPPRDVASGRPLIHPHLVHPEVWLSSLKRTAMTRTRHTPEQIVAKLRQVDGLVAQGHIVAEAIRSIAVT